MTYHLISSRLIHMDVPLLQVHPILLILILHSIYSRAIATRHFSPKPLCTSPEIHHRNQHNAQCHCMGKALQSHPHTAFNEYLQSGITRRFRIGFNRKQLLKLSSKNICSALDNSQVVQQYLSRKSSKGHIAGPLPLQARSNKLLRDNSQIKSTW